MRVGVDLDNTIVSYDVLFHRLATERYSLPPQIASNKQAVRDFLRSQGQELLWTELQGIAYGARMNEAPPFPGVLDFLRKCRATGERAFVISHRTRFPVIGQNFDLHHAARQWLVRNGVLGDDNQGHGQAQVFLAATREEKLRTIAEVGCQVFIDDLPELLTDANFPAEVARFLFDPQQQHSDHSLYRRVASWRELTDLLVPR